MRLIECESEYYLFELLTALNVSGINPEVPCVSTFDVDHTGKRPNIAVQTFLATLTEPDASFVNYITSDENGHSRCVVGCENCGSEARYDWEPTYPVTAVLGVEPDAERAEEDDIDTWWRLKGEEGPAPEVDWQPSPEDISGHTMFWGTAPHDDGRSCHRHQRLGAHVFVTMESATGWGICLRPHADAGPHVSIPKCPECKAGKCPNCVGQSLGSDDELYPCPCDHEPVDCWPGFDR